MCEGLVSELHGYKLAHPQHDCTLIDNARAALAQPEPEVARPTEEELLELMPDDMRDEFSYAAKTCSDATGGQVSPRIFRVCLNTAALNYARAVLTRFGHQPAPAADDSTLRDAALLALTTLEGWSNYDQWVWPISAMEQAKRGTTEALASLKQALSRPAPTAEGEVGELVAWLRDAAFDLNGSDPAKSMLTRAADLLEQRHPAPVPVAERLPGAEDCDAEGRCWAWNPDPPDNDEEESWVLQPRAWIDSPWTTHWLPANALPLPSGEVEA